MKRRNFIKVSSAVAFASLYPNILSANAISFKKSFTQKLAIPSLATFSEENGFKVFDLSVQKGKMSFLNGAMTSTYGVNGDFLGPTIRVKKNDKILLHVNNKLDETTTLHWHGLKIPGSSDGGPHNVIKKGTKWSTNFDIKQDACTAWYHPHTLHKTGEQVFKGIAGFFIIDDENSLSIDLPKEYGVDDIPMVFQDRRFGNDGEFIYKQSMHDTMMGVTGNVHLVNGVVDPFVEVDAKPIRFRMLNGSNSRIYNLMFEDNYDFYQIAGDSSFLPEPVKLKNFILSPGERVEIVMDFSSLAGKTLFFGDGVDKRSLVQFRVKNSKKTALKLPTKLVDIKEYKNISTNKVRNFEINMSMMFLGINGKQMDINRIDEVVKKDTYEIWEIQNPSPRPHPFHIHGTVFKILSRDGKKPLINELGLKDTVLVYGREKVKILVKFEHLASEKFPYMYHCHILEHEDAGMMGQFSVIS